MSNSKNLIKSTFERSVKNLNDLFDFLLLDIFELCDIKDLFNFRRVCKKWKSLVDRVKIDELVYQNPEFVTNWYYINKPVKNVLEIGFESLFKSDPKYYLLESCRFGLKSLKRLRIDYPIVGGKFDLKHLNKFVELEHLELLNKHTYGTHTLTLPKLKVFYLYNLRNGILTIDCPNLKVLNCRNGLEVTKIVHKKSIVHLDNYFFENGLRNFKGVEYLKIHDCMSFENNLKQNFLKHLPNLKELRIRFNKSFSTNFDKTKETLRDLIGEKKSLNKKVNIYFEDALLTDTKQIDELNEKNYSNLNFDIMHLNLV